MQIVIKQIGDIIPYEKNPRKNDEAVEYVANSIKEFGFKVPIVIDKDNVIVAGHTRHKAAKKLGLKEVPCIIADDLNEEQIKAYRLADNKVSEKAKWDKRLLEDELDDLFDLDFDMTSFGFELTEETEEVEEGEEEFPEILGEEHNYIVLYFDNEVDWLQAETLFELSKVQNLSTRKDGKITDGMKSYGIGRVIEGKKAMDKLLGVRDENIG